jgi:hypothetical protein
MHAAATTTIQIVLTGVGKILTQFAAFYLIEFTNASRHHASVIPASDYACHVLFIAC